MSLFRRDFTFDVPEGLIAQHPVITRDDSRLLVREASGLVRHSCFKDLPELVPPGSLIIINDSKVIPSRLVGQIKDSRAKVEVFLLMSRENETNSDGAVWEAIGKPMKKLKENKELNFYPGLTAKIIFRKQDIPQPSFYIKFDDSPENVNSWLKKNGLIPLPPYIKRTNPKPAAISEDTSAYQTVYAREKPYSGSVAAPTAGLHFTKEILKLLEEKGNKLASLTLDVGGGTFLPVKTERLQDHVMHKEKYLIPKETMEKILLAIEEKRKIIFVGTTVLRCLEAYYEFCEGKKGRLLENSNKWLETDLFIFPKTREDRFQPWAASALLTNFHQPESTLFMLISALLGLEEAKKTYLLAIKEKYRFFSYGDACLFWWG